MVRLIIVILLLVLMLPLTITVPSLASEQSQWVQYSHAASRMYDKKNYQRAAELYETAAQCAQDEHRRPDEIANTLLNLADCQIEISSFRAAWANIVRARSIIESQHLIDDPIALRLLRRETYYYQRRGSSTQAVACQKNVVEKVRTIFGDSTALISEYITLQYMQAAFRQPKEAAQTGLVALALMKKVKFDPYCDKWLWVLNRTGESMLTIGDTNQGISMYIDSVRMAVPCKSVVHGGFALGRLVDIAANEHDAKSQAKLVAELLPLSDKLCAIDRQNEQLQKMSQRLKDMQAAPGTAPVP
ncbi:MAG TPA: hypothetical protein V6C69_03105 [Trichormus sp.]